MKEVVVDVLIVGGGMAADRLLTSLLALGYTGELAVASAEPDVGYNRVLLPGFLAGSIDQESLFMSSSSWRQENNVKLFSGCEILNVDLDAQRALSDEITFRFSKIVFATGSSVNYPNLEGIELSGVVALRNLAQARALQTLSKQRILVLGGGLLGLEAADALAQQGHSVTVAHRGPFLMNRQLDSIAGAKLADALMSKGIRIACEASVTKLVGIEQVEQVCFGDGRVEEVDTVLVATGVRPCTELAAQAGLKCGSGIRVDHQMCAERPGVYAIGECAQVEGEAQSLVEVVNRQADALARTICSQNHEYVATTCGTHLKVSGLELYAIGDTSNPDAEDLVIEDKGQGVYRRLFIRGGQFVGSVLFGDTRGATHLANRIGEKLNNNQLEELAFGAVA